MTPAEELERVVRSVLEHAEDGDLLIGDMLAALRAHFRQGGRSGAWRRVGEVTDEYVLEWDSVAVGDRWGGGYSDFYPALLAALGLGDDS